GLNHERNVRSGLKGSHQSGKTPPRPLRRSSRLIGSFDHVALHHHRYGRDRLWFGGGLAGAARRECTPPAKESPVPAHRLPPVLPGVGGGCGARGGGARAAFDPRRTADGPAGPHPAISDARWPEPATAGLHDATLLPRRMQALRIDPEALARDEPLMFQSLAIRCRRCPAPERCARDLERARGDPLAEDWKDYCVNVALLRMLSAIEGIGNRPCGAGPNSPQ